MSTVYPEKIECVVCGNKFIYHAQGSCSIFSHNLDLMPEGAAIIPWPIAKCPKCGLVGENFSKDEKNLLIEYIQNNTIDIKKPNYYLLAKQNVFLKMDNVKIANNYVNATWESYKDHDDCVIPLMKKTINQIDKIESLNKENFNYQIIKLDFLRRLGYFERGNDLIEKIKKNKVYHGLSYRDEVDEVLNIQEKLIAKKDMDVHTLPGHLRLC